MRSKPIITVIAICGVLLLGACAQEESAYDTNLNTVQDLEDESSQDNQSLEIESESIVEEDMSKEIEEDITTELEKESTYNRNTEKFEQEDSGIDEESVIEGYAYENGIEVPLTVGFEVESISRGEDAYKQLYELNQDIKYPSENEEYIIVTFNVSYIDGNMEELFMFENRASMKEAALYFSLANSSSNAYDMTSYLTNSIYDISILKGQSSQGAVAFLQEKGNKESLYFVGFGTTIEFNINEL